MSDSPSAIAMRTLVRLVVLFMLLGIIATEASAQITTEIGIYNNTVATLTFVPPVVNWSNQEWSTKEGYSIGPPQTINPGTIAWLESVATGFPTNGTGGTINYTIGSPESATALVSIAFTWPTPWSSIAGRAR